MLFKYKAVDKEGKVISGEMSADNAADLEQRLKEVDYELIKSKPVKQHRNIFSGKVSTKDLVSMCVHLAHLERAGVPLFESLPDLRDSVESPRMASLIGEIYENLKSGIMFSEALAKRPEIFDSIFISTVAAGEKTGNLAHVFDELSAYLKWNDEIKRRLLRAISYPVGFLLVIVAVVSMLMIFVVPKITGFLQDQDTALPTYTVALVGMSDFFSNYFEWILIFSIGAFAVLKLLTRLSSQVAYFMDSVKLKMPLLGKIRLKVEIARFCNLLALSYKSELEIIECIEVAKQVVKNRVIKSSIEVARDMIVNGSSIAKAFEATRRFPALAMRMINTGEESGDLNGALQNVIFFYNKEIDESMNFLLAAIKPILILLLGGVLAWIAISIFGPIYSSFSTLEF